MTTLCLCDWVETKFDRERRRAGNDATAPPAGGPLAPCPTTGVPSTRADDRDEAIESRIKKEYAT